MTGRCRLLQRAGVRRADGSFPSPWTLRTTECGQRTSGVRDLRIWTDIPRGLTLLELVAVLVILAIVATVAVNSLQPRVEQIRWEQAQQLLEEVRQSSLGTPRAKHDDGSPLVTGFVADIGRLPMPAIVQDPELSKPITLRELWDATSPLAIDFPFRFRAGPKEPIDFSSVRLPCGWRGPYLTLGVGQKTLLDPWARPLSVHMDASGVITNVGLQSLPGSLDDEPPSVEMTTGLVTVSGVISWRDQASPTDVTVALLAPDPQQSLELLAVHTDEDSDPGAFLFSRVPIGLRALCVKTADRLIVRYVTVPSGGLSVNVAIGGAE